MNTIDLWRKKTVDVESLLIESDDDLTRLWPECYVQKTEDWAYEVYDRLHDSWIKFQSGDRIVRGVHGEFFPVPSEVFDATYRQVPLNSLDIIDDIRAEIDRQGVLWGIQTHPSQRGDARVHMGVTEEEAKAIVEDLSERGELTWADIAMEEFAEALDAETDEERIVELIQVTAVVANWINSIQCRIEEGAQ